jgi:hypothetical protein
MKKCKKRQRRERRSDRIGERRQLLNNGFQLFSLSRKDRDPEAFKHSPSTCWDQPSETEALVGKKKNRRDGKKLVTEVSQRGGQSEWKRNTKKKKISKPGFFRAMHQRFACRKPSLDFDLAITLVASMYPFVHLKGPVPSSRPTG